jgi:uncharacterized protein YjbI with pentapeptide repeats
MSDTAPASAEAEAPVNPYSLLDAVNTASAMSHTAWLIFIAVMVYVMIAVAGVTHKDLLLETPVTLPILQVNIRLAQFFVFAPILLVLFHLGVLAHLVLLARKTLAFDGAVRALELTSRHTHPLRLELHNFFLVQALAGPHRSLIVSALLHGMVWLTFVVFPVLLLLYIQIAFLPYHDATITWTHRAALGADLALLILIGTFLARAEASFFKAIWHTTAEHPFGVATIAGVLAVLAFFSLCVATVPGEALDRTSLGPLAEARRESDSLAQRLIARFALPSLTHPDGSVLGLFHRNLIVTDQKLITDKDAGGFSINLRGRDLRHARLDRTDLQRVDLTAADLEGASFVAADLREARLQCAQTVCTRARGANFTRTNLAGARASGADLRDASFEEANLAAAELSAALLAGANFSSARLEKANLAGGTHLEGANFRLATLQGAELTGAQAQSADFSIASMQGAVLTNAQLQGAILRDANLDGADLHRAQLHGADLTSTRLRGADLRGAGVWQSLPPQPNNAHVADMSEIMVNPLDQSGLTRLSAVLERLDNARVRGRAKEALAPLMNPAEASEWAGSQEHQDWQTYARVATPGQPDAYKTELTDYLARMMCRSRWSNGAVATGIARRALAPHFRGELLAIYDRLKAPDCAASESVARTAVRDLALAVDNLRQD